MTDVATEKMASISPMNPSLLLPLPLVRGPPIVRPVPFTERRLPREEFHQFIIRTIDEALRLLEDEPEDEGVSSQNRSM